MCVWVDSPDRYIQPLLLWVSNPSYMHAGNLGDFLDILPCYIQTLVLRISYISRLHPTTALVIFKPILQAWNLEYPWGILKKSYVAMLHPNSYISKFQPIFHAWAMHTLGTLLRNFENLWHTQGTFDPTTALLSWIRLTWMAYPLGILEAANPNLYLITHSSLFYTGTCLKLNLSCSWN